MGYKHATSLSLLFILVFAAIYSFSINSAGSGASNSSIGPTYFPNLLTILLVIFCIVSFFQTRKQTENKKITIQNLRLIFVTIGITIVYLIVWLNVGFFYILSFLYLTSLIILYKSDRSIKGILTSSVIGMVLILFVYFIFGKLMYISF